MFGVTLAAPTLYVEPMSLCLKCGLCCDGTMFQVANVTPEEADRLEGKVELTADRTQLVQGCRALDGCRCGVYLERPAVCRTFKCLALASLEAGKLSEAEAHEAIDEVQGRRKRVAELLGVDDVHHAVGLAREQVGAGTASQEVSDALRRLRQALLIMQLQPADSLFK